MRPINHGGDLVSLQHPQGVRAYTFGSRKPAYDVEVTTTSACEFDKDVN